MPRPCHSRRLYLYYWLLLITLAAGGLAACSQEPEQISEIAIGVIAPLTGDFDSMGDSTVNAAELAVGAINDAGGLLVGEQKYRLILRIEDDKNMPDTAVSAARKLIFQEGIVAIIGPHLSHSAIRVASLAEEAGIPMITPSSTNPETTAGKQYVFRVAFIDSFQGQVMANFARFDLEAGKAAVLYDIANAYNRDIAEIFKQVFEDAQGQIVAFESYTTGEEDFTQQLTRILHSEADVLFLPNFSQEVSLQAQQVRAIGINAIIIGSDSWGGDLLSLEPTLDGAFFSTHYSPDIANREAQQFVNAYQARYGRPPDEAAALTYDAFGLLFRAMQSEPQVTPESIRQGLQQIKLYEGVSGTMTFDNSGDPQRSAVILRITEGKTVMYKLVDP